MVKKISKGANKEVSAAVQDSGQLADAIKESAQQIWLAGLGAFAKAQEEGGKVFQTLVKEGTGLHNKTRSISKSNFSEVTDKMSKVAGGIGKQATEGWDKLENVFEERVSRALQRMRIPSQNDIDSLKAQIAELNATVQVLSGRSAKASKASAKPVAKSITKTTTKSSTNSQAKSLTAAKKARTRKTA